MTGEDKIPATDKIKENAAWTFAADRKQVQGLERSLQNASNVTGLYYPIARDDNGFVVDQAAPRPNQELPVPPTDLWHWYGQSGGQYHTSLYLFEGARDVKSLKDALQADGCDLAAGPILDFGCSAGRMLRHFEPEAREVECWGCDIHSAAIQWARTHLSPPFHFLTNTTTPHLPFSDGYFNIIYAGSVFSHIGEMDDAWFLELRRVLKRGGYLYFTYHDAESIDACQKHHPKHHWLASTMAFASATDLLSREWAVAIFGTTPWTQRVIYNREWLSKHLARWFEVRSIISRAYGWQSAMVLRVR